MMNIPQTVLAPASGPASQERYERTVKRLRLTVTLSHRIPEHNREILDGFRRVAIWGFTGKPRTYSTWSRIKRNDLVSFYRERHFISICKIVGKCQSENLARSLWGEDESGDTWEYICFMDRPRTINITHTQINRAVGNKPDYYYRQAEIYKNARLIEELCDGMDESDVEALLKPDQFNL